MIGYLLGCFLTAELVASAHSKKKAKKKAASMVLVLLLKSAGISIECYRVEDP